jgi:predicted RNA-binding Zn-ribbon protein involved in translation (DUF1610 family)
MIILADVAWTHPKKRQHFLRPDSNKQSLGAFQGIGERNGMPSEQELLLYPLDTGEDHACPACGQVMRLFADEAKNEVDILTFRCDRCGRSERFICEN